MSFTRHVTPSFYPSVNRRCSGHALRRVISSAPDATAPVVGNFSPALTLQIGPTSQLGFDVTVSTGVALREVVIFASYNGIELAETIYDGGAFSAVIAGTVSVITNGLRFRFARRGGWPAKPQIKVRAITVNGAENA